MYICNVVIKRQKQLTMTEDILKKKIEVYTRLLNQAKHELNDLQNNKAALLEDYYSEEFSKVDIFSVANKGIYKIYHNELDFSFIKEITREEYNMLLYYESSDKCAIIKQ